MDNGVIFCDLGGILYSFDKNFDPGKHSQVFHFFIEKYSRSVPQYADAVRLYDAGDIGLALDIEQEAVLKWLGGDKGELALPIYFNIEAVKTVIENARVCKFVFVATSRIKTSQAIVNEALRLIDSSLKICFSNGVDYIDMSEFGSKKEVKVWREVMGRYGHIVAVIEDGKENLTAAKAAAKNLGHKPVISNQMVLFQNIPS
jgi:hypothetical protein